jgi:hypothetical protein
LGELRCPSEESVGSVEVGLDPTLSKRAPATPTKTRAADRAPFDGGSSNLFTQCRVGEVEGPARVRGLVGTTCREAEWGGKKVSHSCCQTEGWSHSVLIFW